MCKYRMYYIGCYESDALLFVQCCTYTTLCKIKYPQSLRAAHMETMCILCKDNMGGYVSVRELFGYIMRALALFVTLCRVDFRTNHG
jgi:hypothetical protein